MVEQAFRPALRHTQNPRALAPEVHVTIPYRGTTRHDAYFVTASAFQKQSLLQSDRMAGLFTEVLFHYQQQNR